MAVLGSNIPGLRGQERGAYPSKLASVTTLSGTPVEPFLASWRGDKFLDYGAKRVLAGKLVVGVFDCSFDPAGTLAWAGLTTAEWVSQLIVHCIVGPEGLLAATDAAAAMFVNTWDEAPAGDTPWLISTRYRDSVAADEAKHFFAYWPFTPTDQPNLVRLHVPDPGVRIGGIWGLLERSTV